VSWEPELEELRRREELARRMGGEERVARQHESGRLTVRERIERLFDAGTFHETGALAGRGSYGDDGELTDFLPANTIVGQGRIDGRRAVVQGDDFTVRGGAADAAIWEKAVFAERMAHDLRLPLVRLVDGTGGGGSVKTLEQMGFSYVPPLPGFDLVVKNLSIVPVAAAALGPVAGLGAARVVCSHFSVIVKGTAQLFVAGPPVVAMAGMGETPDKEELGGARTQARAGAVDNVAADEDDALEQIKRFLAYLPENVWEAPPSGDASDPPGRREEELLSIVPRDQRRPYKMRRVLECVLDRGSVFELGAAFGRPTITCLARLGGRPVGVLASDPEHYGGGVTADAAEKTARFVDMRPVPPAGRELRGRAGLGDRHRGRARRHDPARLARALRGRAGERAVGVDPRPQGVRRGGRRPRRRVAAEPPLRVAVRQLGLAADGRRPRGGLPARARGGRGPGRAARGDRRAAGGRDLAVPHGGALQRRGDHRPARHPPDPVRLGRAGSGAGSPRTASGTQDTRAAPVI
jgi:acetyl-CoA carboxylase beta subunit